MTIDGAIETNKHLLGDESYILSEDEIESIKLGNEALKRLNYLRSIRSLWSETLLPGETKEGS